jgi:hypothetical protein
MAEQVSGQAAGYRSSTREVSGWAVGGAIFAATMMMMVGIFQGLTGLVAIFKDSFFVVTPNYQFNVDVTTWGWTHLVLGVVVLLAGLSVLSGRLWARIVGIVMAVLSAIANFAFLPYYPFWSLLIIALDVLAIWGLASYTPEAAA